MQNVHTLVTIEESNNLPRRSFKAFRNVNEAVQFIGRKGKGKGKLRKVQYGSDSRDVRYIVNFQGR